MAYNRTQQRLSTLFLGKQTDLTTAATSYAHALTGSTLDYTPVEERDEYEDVMGVPTYAGRSFLPEPVRHLTTVNQASRLDFNQLLSPLVTGLGAEVASNTDLNKGAKITTPTNATNTRLWEWEPDYDIGLPVLYVSSAWQESTAEGDTKYLTAAKGFCTEIKVGRPETGQCTMASTYQFGKTKTGSSPGTVSIPTVIGVPVKIVGAKIFDTYSAAKSATKASLGTNDICDFEITIGTGHAITETMSNVTDLDYDQEDATPRACMITGSMYDDQRSTGLSTTERGKKNSARFFRASFVSPKKIETTTVGGTNYDFFYTLDIVLACTYTGESFENRANYDDLGRRKLTFEANEYADQTSGKSLYVALQIGTATFA